MENDTTVGSKKVMKMESLDIFFIPKMEYRMDYIPHGIEMERRWSSGLGRMECGMAPLSYGQRQEF